METDEPEIPTPKIPQFDSIRELADFRDSDDLMDFEDELEEIPDLVFCTRRPLRGSRSPR